VVKGSVSVNFPTVITVLSPLEKRNRKRYAIRRTIIHKLTGVWFVWLLRSLYDIPRQIWALSHQLEFTRSSRMGCNYCTKGHWMVMWHIH